MKKILSLVLVLSLVLGSFSFAFAAEEPVNVGELLKEWGALTGDQNGNLNPDQKLDRASMAAILARLHNVVEDAKSFPFAPEFDDADEMTWNASTIAFVAAEGWMKGIGNNKFAPRQEITLQEVVNTMLRALGYEVSWTKVMETAEELGLLAGVDVAAGDKVVRADVFQLMYNTLLTPKMGSELPLGAELEYFTVEEEQEEPVVEELEVVSVSATNLKTMVVEFSKEVDEDTITATSVKVERGTTNVVASRTLLDDNKTLVIEYTSVAQSNELKLTINGVKSVDGTEEIKDYTKTVVVTDTAIPVALGAAAVNAKQFEVFFSEPMNTAAFSASSFQVLNDIKINGVSAIAKVIPNFLTNSVVFELSTVQEAGNYTLEVKNMVDFAGFKAATAEFQISVVEDKAAPVMVNAVAKNINTIEVTFDEPLSANGIFRVNNATGIVATVVPNTNNTRFTLTGFAALDLSAIVQVKVEYRNQRDVVGNEVTDWKELTFAVADDTVLPTASVRVLSGNRLELTFSKSMLTSQGTIQVLNKDKEAHSAVINVASGLFKANTNNTVIELTAAQANLNDVDAGTYYVNIKGMKDATIRANLLPEQTLEIDARDTKRPTVVATYFAQAGVLTGANAGNDDTITFYFSEAMDQDTLRNLSNYVVNGGSALSAITGVSVKSVAADGKSVVITYPNASTTSPAFTIYALKDVAGNMLVTHTNVTKNLSTTLTNTISAKATVTDKIEVTFNTPMASVDPSFIKVQQGGVDFAVPVGATISATDATKVTFTLNRAINTATAGFTVVGNNVTLATNVYGSRLAEGTAVTTIIADEIRPTLVSALPRNAAGDLANNTITLTFSENVTVTTLADLAHDLVVRYADGTLVAYGTGYTLSNIQTTPADKLVITLLPNAKLTNGVNGMTVQLAAERHLRDTNNNYVAPFAPQSVNVTADAVAPTVVTPVVAQIAADGGVATLVFSKELNDTSKTAVQNAITTAAQQGTLGFVWTGATLTITNTHSDNATDFEVGNVQLSITDLVGNTTSNANVVVIPAS